MKKKIGFTLVALVALIAGVVGLSAFEAHVINVTARIENALKVATTPINFGTVFPQEQLDKKLDVTLSDSFVREGRVDDVKYMIRQKPKCGWTTNDGKEGPFGDTQTGEVVVNTDGTTSIVCPDPVPSQAPTLGATWGQLPLLCPYLSKHEVTEDGTEINNDKDVSAFQRPWTVLAGNIVWTEALGRLSKLAGDTLDTWNIDLKVPCFGDYCAQDWEKFVTDINASAIPAEYVQDIKNEHKVFGCDLWIEVTAVSTNDNLALGACGTATGFSASGHMLSSTTYDYTLDSPVNTAAGDSADHAWLHLADASAEAVWDMGSPQSAVWLVPSIDHGPVPEEGNETLLYGSDSPTGPWTLGTHTTIVTNGPSDWISDDHTNKWTFGTPYRYIRAKSTAYDPASTAAQGLFLSDDTEIDAVCTID